MNQRNIRLLRVDYVVEAFVYHISGKRANTHWICFIKGGVYNQIEVTKMLAIITLLEYICPQFNDVKVRKKSDFTK